MGKEVLTTSPTCTDYLRRMAKNGGSGDSSLKKNGDRTAEVTSTAKEEGRTNGTLKMYGRGMPRPIAEVTSTAKRRMAD